MHKFEFNNEQDCLCLIDYEHEFSREVLLELEEFDPSIREECIAAYENGEVEYYCLSCVYIKGDKIVGRGHIGMCGISIDNNFKEKLSMYSKLYFTGPNT
jgi:hypothetical protein